MSERNAAAPQTDIADYMTEAVSESRDADNLSRCIRRIMALPMDTERRCRMVRDLRASGGEKMQAELDRYFVSQLEGIGEEQEILRTQIKELQTVVDDLLLPPYLIARFLGAEPTPHGEFASVWHGGTHSLVGFAEDFDRASLEPGDAVFLSHERNAVIGKAASASSPAGEAAAFVSRIDESTIVLTDRDTEVVVRASQRLREASLKPGDRLLWDRGAQIALARLDNQREKLLFEDIDAAAPDALGGYDEMLHSVLKRFTSSIARPDIAARYGLAGDSCRRLLLKGPPGTGKTTMMRIVASQIAAATGERCRIVTASAASLYSSLYGETEKNIVKCFRAAEEHEGPAIIFFDEIDAIGRVRGHVTGHHGDRALATILAQLEGMQKSDVAVIASTNRPDALDPALRGRFGWELEVAPPDKSAARSIFAIHLPEFMRYKANGTTAPATRELIVDHGVARLYEPNADNLVASLQFRDGKRRVVAARELVSGRLIEQICRAARSRALEREVDGGEAGICLEDMQAATAEAVERLRRTLTPGNVGKYLFDLPQDVDVVAVNAVEPRVDAARYRQ